MKKPKTNQGEKKEMKKIAMLLVCLFALTSLVYSQVDPSPWYPNPERPLRVPYTLNALTLYCVGGSTVTGATYGVFGSTGITLRTIDGFLAGTTEFTFTNGDADTLDHLITTIRNLSKTAVKGAEGGWVIKLATGSYGGNPTYNLTNKAQTACYGRANEKTATVNTTTGISYLFDKSKLDVNQIWHITKCMINVTYGSGTPYLYVYDGCTSTNTVIDQETVVASGKDGRADICDIGTFVSKKNTDLLWEIYNSTIITNRYCCFEYFKENQIV